MSSLFIVGNGFDIAHGIPTKYSDFRTFIIKNYPDALKYRDEIISLLDYKYINEKEFAAEILLSTMDKVGGENWNNFEEALAYIDFSNKLPRPNHKEDETEEEDNILMKDYLLYMDILTSGFIQCTKYWQDFFQLWIREVQIQIKLDTYARKENLRKIFNEPDMLYFTFNYTKTLEKLYRITGVTHIHNYVGQQLVFGHGQDDVMYGEDEIDLMLGSSFLDDMVLKFRKDTDFPLIKHKKFFKKLSYDINKVYSYGFSYGDVDSVYIKRIIKSIAPDAVWNFTTFEANDSADLDIKKNKLRDWGFNGDFNIYEG